MIVYVRKAFCHKDRMRKAVRPGGWHTWNERLMYVIVGFCSQKTRTLNLGYWIDHSLEVSNDDRLHVLLH